jgi:hypothetical protein
MHHPASRIRLTSRTRVREIFEICVQFFRTFAFVPFQSLTSPKPQYESHSFNNPISPSSPSPQAQTDLHTTDKDHANAMQADWKARQLRIPNMVRHNQCSPCRKISNHDPLRARRWMKANFWKKWGSSPQTNLGRNTVKVSFGWSIGQASLSKLACFAYSSFVFLGFSLDCPGWNHKSWKTRYHIWPFGWPTDASSWGIQ